MRKSKQIITLSILIVLFFSFSSVFVFGQNGNKSEFTNFVNKTLPPTTNSDKTIANITDYSYGLNATAKVNRSVFIGYYGIVSVNDTITVSIKGNETSITYFNYTLANINMNNLTYCSFKAANSSAENLKFANATRNYVYQKTENYTTFRIPVLDGNESLKQNDTFYINAYFEFAYPFNYTIENNEQILHYREMLYPLVNNIPIVNGSTTVKKQSGEKQEGLGEKFIDDENHVVTPKEYLVSNASSGILKWENFTRAPFNSTQDYNDDLIMNVWTTSISTVPSEGQQASAATVLFKGVKAYRKIQLDPYGKIKITETHVLQYLGPNEPEGQALTSFRSYALNAFQLTLEPNATVVSLRDQLGDLNIKYQKDKNDIFSPGSYILDDSSIYPGYKVLTVHPRYPVKHGDLVDCTVVYTVPLDTLLLKEKGTNNYSLKLSLLSIYNWTIDNFKLDVQLPRGAVYSQSNYSSFDPYHSVTLSYHKEFKLWKLGFDRIVEFEGNNLSPSDNHVFYIDFSYSTANLFIVYLLIVVGVTALVGIAYFIYWLSNMTREVSGEKEKEFIPEDEIRTFVKLYEEKLSIQDRIRETKVKMSKKKLKAREGKQLLSDLNLKLKKVNEDLIKAKADLASYGGRYKEAVHSIEIDERKLTEERRNQQILQQEYKTNKTLTKESYRKLFRERQNNIEKLVNEIDGKLISLRLLLEE